MLLQDQLVAARVSRKETIDAIEALLTKGISEERELTTDEETVLADLESTKARQTKSIERLEKLLDEKRMLVEVKDPTTPRIEIKREEGEDEKGVYKPFKTFGEFLQQVKRAEDNPYGTDKRLIELNKRAASGANEAVGSEGGFMVQHDFAAEIQKASFDTGVLASKVRQIPISPNSNTLSVNVVDETTRVKGSRWGGVQAYWVAEADAATAKKPKLARLDFRLQRLTALAYVTDELLADAPAMTSLLTQAFSEELAFELDEAILRGDGAGKPLGILNSNCFVAITGESASKVKAADVIGARARLWARSRANSVWLVNQDVEPSLHKMFIAGATSDLHVYTPANGLSGLPYDTLYGRPIIPIEQASSVGTVGDLILADLSQYGMIRKDGAGLESSIHVRFVNAETAFRISIRVDGKPMWLSAITPARGSATQSPFVGIATR